jgi:hypothetical protein
MDLLKTVSPAEDKAAPSKAASETAPRSSFERALMDCLAPGTVCIDSSMHDFRTSDLEAKKDMDGPFWVEDAARAEAF